MWELDHKESWASSIDAFELWCWRRLLRVLQIARRSNQLILKEISPEYSLEGLMLRLKLEYFGYLMRRSDSFEKTLMLGKTVGGRRGWQRMRWLDGITDSMDLSLSNSGGAGDGQGGLARCSPWCHKDLDTSDSVMSDSATPCTATPHTSLSFTISQSLLKLMLIDFVMHPIISFSVVRFSFWLQSYPETGSFPMNLFFASGDQSTGASASVSVILISMQD